MTMDGTSPSDDLGFDALTNTVSISVAPTESVAPERTATSDDPLALLLLRLENVASEQTSVLGKVRTLLALAELRAQTGDALGAERDAIAACNVSRKHASVALAARRHSNDEGELLGQLEVISRIAEHDASRIHAGLLLVRRLDERGEVERSSELLDQLAFAHPGEPRIALARLLSRLAAGRTIAGLSLPAGIEAAGSFVAELLGSKRSTGSHPALSLLGAAHELALGRFAEAKNALDSAPVDDDTKAELGAILLSIAPGREKDALDLLSELARRNPAPRHERALATLAVRLHQSDVLDEVVERSSSNAAVFSATELLVLGCLAGRPLAPFVEQRAFEPDTLDDPDDSKGAPATGEAANRGTRALSVAYGALSPLFGGSLSTAPTDTLVVELARLVVARDAGSTSRARIGAVTHELARRGSLPELAHVLALLDALSLGELPRLATAFAALAALEDEPQGRARLHELAGLLYEAHGDRELALDFHRRALDADGAVASLAATTVTSLGGSSSAPSVPEGVLGTAARIALGSFDRGGGGSEHDANSARKLRELVPGHVILEFVASLFELADGRPITRTITPAESTSARERGDAPARLQRVERALLLLSHLLLDGTTNEERHRTAEALAALAQEPVPPGGRRTALAVARHLSPLAADSVARAEASSPLEYARLAATHLLASAAPSLGPPEPSVRSGLAGSEPSASDRTEHERTRRDHHRSALEEALRALLAQTSTSEAPRLVGDRSLLEEFEDRSSDSVRSSARWLERAQNGATPEERLDAYQRLATLEEWRGDQRSALLFRRALLEEFPAHVPTLLALEGHALSEGRPGEAALLIARILPHLTRAEAPAYRTVAGALALARYDFARAEGLLQPDLLDPGHLRPEEPVAAEFTPGAQLLARRIAHLRALERGDVRMLEAALPHIASFAATDLDLFTLELERAATSLSLGSTGDAAAAAARAASVRSDDFLLAWLNTEVEQAARGSVSPATLESLARTTKSPRLAARIWLAAGISHASSAAQEAGDAEAGEVDSSLGEALLVDADDVLPNDIASDDVIPEEIEQELEPETGDDGEDELDADALVIETDVIETAATPSAAGAEDPTEAAIRCYEASLAAEPSLAAFERLSQLLDERGDHARLRALLEDRLELLRSVGDPRGQLALELWLARLLLELGEPRVAKEHLEAALELSPDSVDALRAHAEVSALLGDHASAEASLVSLRDSLPKGPERLSIVRSLGRIYLEHLKRPESAMDAFEAVLAEEPDDLGAASTLVRTYGILGLGERATTLQTALVQRFTTAEEKRRGALYLAELYERLTQDPKRAAATLERTRRAWPLDADVLEHTAHFMDRQGDVGARRMMVDRVAKDARRKLGERIDPALLDTLARAASLSGRDDESRAITAARAAYLGADAEDLSQAVLGGAGVRALDSNLDGLLAPAMYPLPLRALLQKTGLAMDAAFPVDLSAMQARPLLDGPVPDRLAALTRSTGLGKVDLFVAPSLGHRALPLTSSPPRLVVGPQLAALGPEAMDFLLLRALKLLGQGAGALARSRPEDAWPMLVALLRLFAPQFQPGSVPGSKTRPVDAKKVAQAQALIEQGLARVGYDEDVPTLALEVVGALTQRSDDLGPLPRLVANRAALLGTHLLAGLEAMSVGSPRPLPTRGPARYRWLAAHPDASDLLQFATTDEFVSARQRLGLDAAPGGAPPPGLGPHLSRRPKPAAPPQRG